MHPVRTTPMIERHHFPAASIKEASDPQCTNASRFMGHYGLSIDFNRGCHLINRSLSPPEGALAMKL